MELLADPYYQTIGANFNFVIATCKTAADAFGGSGEDCAEETIWTQNYVNNIRVIHKFVHNYLNLQYYLNKGLMSSTASNVISNDLTYYSTHAAKFSVLQTESQIYQNRFIDFS